MLVCDEGVGMVPRPDSPGLGLGLSMMAQMADEVRVANRHERTGTIVSMRFSLDGSGTTLSRDDGGGQPPRALHDPCRQAGEYPPGIPVVAPGEIYTKAAISYLEEVVAAGGFVEGASDQSLNTLRVVATAD